MSSNGRTTRATRRAQAVVVSAVLVLAMLLGSVVSAPQAVAEEVPDASTGSLESWTAPRICLAGEPNVPGLSVARLTIEAIGSPHGNAYYAKLFVPHGAVVRSGIEGTSEGRGDLNVELALHELGANNTVGQNVAHQGRTLGYFWDWDKALDTGPDWFAWENLGPSRTMFVSLAVSHWWLLSTYKFSVTSLRADACAPAVKPGGEVNAGSS